MRPFLLSLCVLLLWVMPVTADQVVMEFGAPWCGPCQRVYPLIDQIERDGYRVERWDADQHKEMFARYNVTLIPTIIVRDAGTVVDRIEGVATIERIRAKLVRQPAVHTPRKGEPTPAYKYVKPAGRYAAIVRIICETGEVRYTVKGEKRVAHVYGTGTIVRYAGRLVIATVRHVVVGAKGIVIWTTTGTHYKAILLAEDAECDCAILQLVDCKERLPEVVLASGPDAVVVRDTVLESCGYGDSIGKLASNTGRFLDNAMPAPRARYADWGVISGPSRHGDSGGPVFNRKGQLIGVLRATNLETTIYVQTGRVTVTICRGLGINPYKPMAEVEWQPVQCQPGQCQPGQCSPQKRSPIFGVPPQEPIPGPMDEDETAGVNHATKQYVLGFRNQITGEISGIKAEQAAIRQQLDTIIAQLQKAPQGQAPDPGLLAQLDELKRRQAELDAKSAQPPPPPVEHPGNALEKKLDAFLEKLPIKGPLASLAEKQLDSEHPLQRFFGATTAIVLITVIGGLLVIGCIMLGHKVYQAAHAHKAQIDTALGNLPVGGAQLASAFDKLDAFNTANVDSKIQAAVDKVQADLAAIKAKAESALHVGTAAALATPAGPAAAVAAGIAAIGT